MRIEQKDTLAKAHNIERGTNMKLSNKAYDIIKWLALVLIPATATLWLTLGKVWAFPYLTEVGATIPAIGLFLAGIIGISTDAYHKEVSLYGQDLAIAEDGIKEDGEEVEDYVTDENEA